MTKAAIYCRVSSEQQKELKTIESQLEELKAVSKKDKVEVVKNYIDDGWSGSTLARPGLDQLRDDAQKGLWNTLYVYSADRLGRDHIDQGIILRELKKAEIQVIFRNRPLTEENKLLSDIESLLAEHEKRMFMERTRRGKLHKAKSGKLMRCKSPYGYRFVKKNNEWKLEINPEEVKIIKLIFELYFQYQAISKVAKELLKRGIYTKNKCVWNRSQITNMLNNEAYIGQWHYNKYQNVEPKERKRKFYRRPKSSHKLRDKKDWIVLKVPAIISKGTLENAQELLKRNHKVFAETKETYILSGLLRCSECGSRMVGCNWTKQYKDKKYHYPYYRCSHIQKSFPYHSNHTTRYVKAEDLDTLVWGKIKEAFQNPKLLLQYITHLNQDRNTEALKEEMQNLLKKKVQIKRSKDKLFELYDLEQIEKDDLAERIGNYTQAEKETVKLLSEIDLRLKQTKQKNIVIESLKRFAKLTKAQLNLSTPSEKKSFLKGVIKELCYNPITKEVDIVGHIPMVKIPQKQLERIPFPTLLSLSSGLVQGLERVRFDINLKVAS